MRTLQPISEATALALIRQAPEAEHERDVPWEGVTWREWNVRSDPGWPPIVNIVRNGEKLGWYILR